jgi:Domain of unknown function (DUF6305)
MNVFRKSRSCWMVLIVGLVMSSAWSHARAAQIVLGRPGIITSVGQSADVAIVKALLNTQLKLGLEYKPLAQPADIAGMKTVVVVVGASAKGLGTAGLDMDKEIARARAVVKAARDQGAQILVMHTGGEQRRGKTTNDLIDIVVPEATCVVVLASGNKDKYFTTLAARKNTPLSEVDKLAAAGEVVKTLFK